MRKVAFLFMMFAGVFFLVPGEAQAQPCDDRCVDIHDEEGNHVGFGCAGGGSLDDCEATRTSCELDACGLASIMLDDGTHLATLPSCQLDDVQDWAELVARGEARETRIANGEVLTS